MLLDSRNNSPPVCIF